MSKSTLMNIPRYIFDEITTISKETGVPKTKILSSMLASVQVEKFENKQLQRWVYNINGKMFLGGLLDTGRRTAEDNEFDIPL